MKPARRTLALLCLALAGLQGCSSPLRQPVLLPDMADAGAPATIRDSAVMSLTPPSFNENANALPCR